jgi:hypothetical protein
MTAHFLAAGLAGALAVIALAIPPGASRAEPPARFDIAPFALPNCPPGEYRFEEPRDVVGLEVRFRGRPPARFGVQYLRRHWPQVRLETVRDLEDPCGYGWMPIDDWFNGRWQEAAVAVRAGEGNTVIVAFQGLSAELPETANYDVTFRRTLGLRLVVPDPGRIERVRVFTASAPAVTALRVELDAGRVTPSGRVGVTGYNVEVTEIRALRGTRAERGAVALLAAPERAFAVGVSHMRPVHRRCNDDGLVTFALDADTFTVSLTSLQEEGPVWCAEQGVYVARADDPTSFADYRRAAAGEQNLNRRVAERPEQTYAGACNGQPRPHPVSYNLGVKQLRQRFRVEADGDLVLHKWNVTSLPAADTGRYSCDGDARFFFGLERAAIVARFTDPPPAPVYNVVARDGGVAVEQSSLAVPLLDSLQGEPRASDATVVALVRFRFTNHGDAPATAELPVGYSQRSRRTENAYAGGQDDRLVPDSERDSLRADGDLLVSDRQGQTVPRARWEGAMAPAADGRRVVFRRLLQPGEGCELLLKVPFVALDRPEELAALAALDFERAHAAVTGSWRREARRGAQLVCPEPRLTGLHASHLTHVAINDAAMPDGSGLLATSVGTSTYGNFANEACMVVHELDERGLHEEARRRLEVWIKYQGTARQPGNFSDYEGMYYGAGGFEQGDYNQHHGWVLWGLAEHYFLGGDSTWMARVAPSLVAGCDWVFRQRRLTLGELPHSRGWERGFLPAGSLEDVTDFHYWLSTNALTWRGVDAAARALAAIGHPEAERLGREAAAYGADLVRGFETARRHAPLVRLRDGRWVPHYPSRLYWRGRDVGWIREVLEGSVYLLLSGLYDPRGPQAQWILDDYQDNLYVRPPYGYPLSDLEADWFDRGGFSIQPNLLAGLLPHLDRDEPEHFLRMFFNAWCSCYRDEIGAMVEHPNPQLGYSSAAHFKASDEANAVSWLRAMFVYASDSLLHVGRALPREWLASAAPSAVSGVRTRHGTVGASYRAAAGGRRITATLDLDLRAAPPVVLVRFRHPAKLPLRAVRVDGRPHGRFDPRRNDVDITGCSGRVVVEADF